MASLTASSLASPHSLVWNTSEEHTNITNSPPPIVLLGLTHSPKVVDYVLDMKLVCSTLFLTIPLKEEEEKEI